MPKQPIIPTSAKSIAKQKKVKEITALLELHGPLRAVEIVKLIDGISITATNRYLAELTLSGHIKKIHASGNPKNVLAYQFQSAYGAKTDIVSIALSNPLHQLHLSLFKKMIV